MSEPLRVLLDQNIPRGLKPWLIKRKPSWTVQHTSDVDLQGAKDQEIFRWAQERDALILTFDEDFADQRTFPVGAHSGVVRLRVWPTTVEEVKHALSRLFEGVPDKDLRHALVIVGRRKIRVRRP